MDKNGRFSQIPSTFAIIVVKLDMTGACEIHPPPPTSDAVQYGLSSQNWRTFGRPSGTSVAHGGLRQVPDNVDDDDDDDDYDEADHCYDHDHGCFVLCSYRSLQFLYVLTVLVYTTVYMILILYIILNLGNYPHCCHCYRDCDVSVKCRLLCCIFLADCACHQYQCSILCVLLQQVDL